MTVQFVVFSEPAFTVSPQASKGDIQLAGLQKQVVCIKHKNKLWKAQN